MSQLSTEEITAQDDQDIRDLNWMFWTAVQRRAQRDPQGTIVAFGLDRTMVQRVARMSSGELRSLVNKSSSAATHFVFEKNKALELAFAQIEAQESPAMIEATRLAAVIQAVDARLSD